MNPITKNKQATLLNFITREVVPRPAIQGVVVIGSVAKGTAREDSDIDAVVFLDPFDLYAVPAESKWDPTQGKFYDIFRTVENGVQLDFKRLDLMVWEKSNYVWPESMCAELREGWVAFDRHDRIQELIYERTEFPNDIRQSRLDEAIMKLDWLLSEGINGRAWLTLGPNVAHYRLHTAFNYLVQALFAYNRRWRTLHSRELSDLFRLVWLPEGFEAQSLLMMNALSITKAGYQERVEALHHCLLQLVAKCQHEGLYGEDAIGEAFVRQHNEPGYAWNMAEWQKRHHEQEM